MNHIAPLCNRPSKTRPRGFFSPSQSENLAFPVPGEIFLLYPASLWLTWCDFYIPGMYHLCMFEKGKTVTLDEAATWCKIYRPGDVSSENPMGLSQRGVILNWGYEIKQSYDLRILFTRASDLMAAHDPRLWQTLQDFSQNLAIWTSRCMLLEETGN